MLNTCQIVSPYYKQNIQKDVCWNKFPGIKVEDNLICDGHHRYIASLLANFPLARIPGSVTSATKAVHWKLVIFEEEDWDTAAKIAMLNELDAEYNNIPILKIIEMLK